MPAWKGGMGCLRPVPASPPAHTATSHSPPPEIPHPPIPLSARQLFPERASREAPAAPLLPRQHEDKPISNVQMVTTLHLPVRGELGAESQSRKHLVSKGEEEKRMGGFTHTRSRFARLLLRSPHATSCPTATGKAPATQPTPVFPSPWMTQCL